METREDWRALAATRGRDEFAAAYAHPFLLALSGMDAPPPPQRTLRMEGGAQLMAALMAERRRLAAASPRGPAVWPVRKVQANFPSMITVGRARNNDIVVPDALVSKFHAFFRQVDGEWMLADAGSANGTKVGDVELTPKGAAERVRPGDRVSFGVSAFRFVDAAGLWAALREPSSSPR
jgi:FHA domain